MASLADIRARLAAQDTKKSSSFTDGEGPVYPHWTIDEGQTAIVRFLNDNDPTNTFFWVERAMFKFPFKGVKGDPTASQNTIVQVPCMEMYGEKDAVLDEVRGWFKDTSMEEMGRKYWKKRTYIFQGFVRSDPKGAAGPENPIRRFMISPQIFTLIKSSLMDPEIEYSPTDVNKGLDFRIAKQEKGGYADYTNSSWARKETALTDEETAAIAKYGLNNLVELLPPKPTTEVQAVIREMFEASVDGEPYDPERWASYYTPKGISKVDNAAAVIVPAAPAAEAAPVVAEAAPVVAEAAPVDNTPPFVPDEVAVAPAVEATPEVPANAQKAQDILAMIRARQE